MIQITCIYQILSRLQVTLDMHLYTLQSVSRNVLFSHTLMTSGMKSNHVPFGTKPSDLGFRFMRWPLRSHVLRKATLDSPPCLAHSPFAGYKSAPTPSTSNASTVLKNPMELRESLNSFWAIYGSVQTLFIKHYNCSNCVNFTTGVHNLKFYSEDINSCQFPGQYSWFFFRSPSLS